MVCKWYEADGSCLLYLEPCRGESCINKEGKHVDVVNHHLGTEHDRSAVMSAGMDQGSDRDR